ncbi:MAG: hypothetical protein Q7U94_00760 [Sideroxyarcus sp.]|nr:hypothetical protein [Sideroxyarcus sp.]
MGLKIASYILIATLVYFRKGIFYGAANTGLRYYKTSRAFLLLLFALGLAMYFIGPQIYGEYFLQVLSGRTLVPTPLFSMHSTIFVAVTLALDINYKFSRRNGYESNYISSTLVLLLGVIPAGLSCFYNKPLIILILAVFVAGFGARKKVPQS